ncbi:nucleotidyltransferase domain-containing protein [Azospirillum halopraeferens]|uniref:nucleotidyltransferase domain-containing protein n=1 Tax=Azospirillum halopraeferens TaxID=34010 RepID=UPI000424A93F|nr:nucleotidyltransferase domain-containing protein [Azospirillum halopraeferens]
MSWAPDHLPPVTVAARARRREAVVASLREALAHRRPAGVREVVLFGSWARGTFDGRSDIDLLVVTDDDGIAFDVRGLPDAERIDAVVIPAARLAGFLANGHTFYRTAVADGVRIYPSAPHLRGPV